MNLNYVLIRLMQVVPTFFLIMIIVFILVRLLPGDPTSAVLGIHATDEAVTRINNELGLNRPVPVQFAIFLENFFKGDLGYMLVMFLPTDARGGTESPEGSYRTLAHLVGLTLGARF